MNPIRFQLRYSGGHADLNLLPAHLGAESIEGITWSFSLIGNYLATGKIKRRGRLNESVQFFISPSQKGSYVQDLIAAITTPSSLFIANRIGSTSDSNVRFALRCFLKHALNQVCGNLLDTDDREQRLLSRFPSGDLEAIAEAIEPSIIRAHSVILQGASKLYITDRNNQLITLDGDSKEYVRSSILQSGTERMLVGISALNANSANGRAYLPYLGRTVSFRISNDADKRTSEALSAILSLYTRRLPNYLYIECQIVKAADDRLKQLIVLLADHASLGTVN